MSELPKASREMTSVSRISSGEKCVFNWKIENISSWFSVYTYEGFKLIKSPEFTLKSKYSTFIWRLELDVHNEDYPCLSLRRIKPSSGMSNQIMKSILSILNAEGSSVKSWEGNSFVKAEQIHLAFVTASKEECQFIFNGNLNFRFEMTIFETEGFVEIVPAPTTSKPDQKLVENCFQWLFETQRFSDLVVSCEDQEFHVHKCILAAHSPVFDAMLSHDMVEKNSNNVIINDVDAGTIKTMLHYMYTKEVNLSTPEEAVSLYSVANKYQLPHLIQKCAHFLANNLTPEVATDMLALACLHNDEILKEVTIDFISFRSSCILNSPKWLDFVKAYPTVATEILFKVSKGSHCEIKRVQSIDISNKSAKP